MVEVTGCLGGGSSDRLGGGSSDSDSYQGGCSNHRPHAAQIVPGQVVVGVIGYLGGGGSDWQGGGIRDSLARWW